ncbi:MAG: exodeoxyribonuclease V subunit gamma [Mycolicibacterium cosmeticum]|nr:exodeoxyribonuclease V subunit gamma [Mycolicibacterium cosmeticum]
MLTIHRAERADTLIGPLAALLSSAPADAFTPDVVAVPSRGVERWLAQQLSLVLGASPDDNDGISANILFPSPGRVVNDVLATVSGIDPDDDPWVGNRFRWAVLQAIDGATAEGWGGPLAHHLGIGAENAGHRLSRRYATAANLANLFSSYSDNRPDMINAWLAGSDTDGIDAELDDDMRWQPELWRHIRSRLDVASPAERLRKVLLALQESQAAVRLPERLSLFGPTRLSRTHLDVIGSLSIHRDVHLWLTHPSPHMWELLANTPVAVRRNDDETVLQLSNPLLASLARDTRELQQRLPSDVDDIYHKHQIQIKTTILGRIQNDVRHGRVPLADSALRADSSITIHACHGHVRQVEVLRDTLLHLLNDDPTLQPRDIIVLCPDIETFAPLVKAAFGQEGHPHPGQQLRVRIADRGAANVNPLLHILQTLMKLANGRVTATEVLDLAAETAVSRLFGFTADDLETLRQWCDDAGARWGIGRFDREAFGMGDFQQNTLSLATSRILLGVTSDETNLEWLGSTLPLDDVDSSDVDLAGRFAEFIDRLHVVLVSLRVSHPVNEWSATFEEALDWLTDVAEIDRWQRIQAGRALSEAIKGAGATTVSPADIRAMLSDLLRPQATRSNFRTGEITVATLIPMRFVPHKVVAILGLDDEAFPRVGSIHGDDILAIDPCIGERDARSEDRQLLLDAIMSATDHLVVCYTGADPATGERRPPSPPLADLIDTIRLTAAEGYGVVTHQPLQPFDPTNFVAAKPFSFDPTARAGALALRERPVARPPFLPGRLAEEPTEQVELDDLVNFFINPTGAFLRQRLGIVIPRTEEDPGDALPLTLDGLQKWEIGDRMLSAVLAGKDPQQIMRAEIRRGTLPPGELGRQIMSDVAAGVRVIATTAAEYVEGQVSDSVDVSLQLDDVRLRGTVNDLYGHVLLSASYSRLSPKHRISAWVRLLAIAAATGESNWQAVTLGRATDEDQAARRAVLDTPDDAAAILRALIDVRAAGLREALPLGVRTSAAYAEHSNWNLDEAYQKARQEWTSEGQGSYRKNQENSDHAICTVYGSDAPFTNWWDMPAPPDQQWVTDEQSHFVQLALRVWRPLLDCETMRNVR